MPAVKNTPASNMTLGQAQGMVVTLRTRVLRLEYALECLVRLPTGKATQARAKRILKEGLR